VEGYGEAYDPDPGVWVGFLDCPGCGARFIYLRKEAGRGRRRVKRRHPVQLPLAFEEATP
jgi:hypothetical protein